ncbi:MAG: tetratricopeptide repeat protein [Proteobacteria bacterium]|nr:tetratricopeptide repeat protein [Pseudomonadota bacterium]
MARLIAALVALTIVSAAEARQNDSRLDALFERLAAADDFADARSIEASIWSIWTEAGDDALDEHMARGVMAMNHRNFDVALESFNAIVAADPDFAEGWNKRATLYFLMGRYDDSIRDVERTLALEPRHFGALSGMGLIVTEFDDAKAALAWFEQALEVNPHMPFVALRVRILHEMLGGKQI